jgi:endonuclease/exonuclease/phosphatase family metal-dependent hydrolase
VARRPGAAIVAGDLNATDQSRAYAVLVRSLGDAHRQAGQALGHTFPADGGSFRGLPIPRRVVRIDMVLLSDELEATECRVMANHGESDHLPVAARLAWSRGILD